MTIVVGTVNGAVVVSIVAHVISQFVGNTFFGVANQQAAQNFGGRAKSYIDDTASQSNIDINKKDVLEQKEEVAQHKNRLKQNPVKNFGMCMLKKHMITSPIFGTHPYLSRMERATIAGSTFMLMVTSSSLIQDATGLDGNLPFTLVAGFVIV